MPFAFTPAPQLPDVVLVEPRIHGDERGWFAETYKRSEFEAAGIRVDFRQDNHARSTRRGILRGLHYQEPPAPQAKLVRCTVGAIFDVAVDIRQGSPTFGRWYGAELTASNHRMLYVPEGFAHGYCTVDEVCEVVYKTSNEYRPDLDRAIRWDDPAIGVEWPVKEPVLSRKDQAAPLLAEAKPAFSWEAPR